MNDALVLILLIGGSVLLDVLAIRFGYDSRDGFRLNRWPADFHAVSNTPWEVKRP
jgi:hypothetical protein